MSIIAQFDGLSTILMILGLAIITFMLLRRLHRRLDGRTKNRPFMEKSPRFDPHNRAGGSLPPLEKARWEGEMCDIARETSARLDSKMHALAELIRQADAAAERLETNIRKTSDGPMNH